ncbi:class I adenylate-forming enzyme family protein [Sphingomonas sp. OK281]|uniref:class I adenylate-forming enzyme family protein n=1 Tax=Sphingomonas sp. OK281 TaxID=1881067 RepID=UPI000B898470|nr:fatty acid--CoA ligase family protein [Sphingomonas sp. OK281]
MRPLTELCAETLTIDPSRSAIEFDGIWHDWGAVQRLAAEMRALLAALGIGVRTVSFVPRNRPSALAAFLGMLVDGRSVRMIYAFQSAPAIAAAIERAGSAVVVMAEDDFTPEVRAVLASRSMAGIALSGMSAQLVTGFDRAEPRPDDGPPRVEILTSGTTGPPKPFAIPHAVIAQFVLAQGMSLIDDPAEPPFLMSFPIGNISGVYSIAASLLRGKRIVLLDRFSVEAWRAFVVRYRPSTGGAPPAAVAMILDAEIPVADLSSLKFFSTGAAPLDPDVQRRFEVRYGIPILLSYGATEFGGPVAAMTPQLHDEWGPAKFGSVGRAMPGVALRVRHFDTGEILGPGVEGILEVVSPRMGPDWIRTSDIAVVDADEFLFHRGRADGAIMRGGFKILPETIEAVLLRHPSVSTAAVVGVPDPRVTEVPGAVIAVKPGSSAPSIAALEAYIRQYLPATHCPVHWRFVDALPKNPSFKIDRPALKRMFAGDDPA